MPASEPDPAPGRRPRSRIKRALPGIARRLIVLLWRTCRLEVHGEAALAELVAARRPFVACYWHRHQIFCVRALLDLRERDPGLKLGYLVSPSRDGDAAASVFADLDLHIVRGSATRGGAQALREIYQAIRRDGVSPIVTPDGPTGPLEVFKPGVAMLASLAGAPLVPMSFAASRAISLRSWDRALVPLPFSRVAVVIGEPQDVARGADQAALEAASANAGAALVAAGRQAESIVGTP